jgi:hypothetical protein
MTAEHASAPKLVKVKLRMAQLNRFRDIFPAACCVLLVCCLAAPIPRSLLRGLFITGPAWRNGGQGKCELWQ